MKRSPFFITFLLLVTSALFAQVAINTTGAPPDASAGLDVNFTNKGLLPPRVALTAINSATPVTAPAVGLLVYNTAVAGVSPNNVLPGYYCWNGTRWMAVTIPQGTNIGDMQYWNGTQWVNVPAGSNGQVLTFNGIPTWQTSPCGLSKLVNHVAGAVAPVTKTVIYGTINNIPGEPTKCWITRNLGADYQAAATYDDNESPAGWYWQFNRKQGYKVDGSTRTPNTTWITELNDYSVWIADNDPCTIELGNGWRIPTYSEWNNVDIAGNWTNWNGPWNSGLKLHAAGYLYHNSGYLDIRGIEGHYWSSSNVGNDGWILVVFAGNSYLYTYYKEQGCSVRCVRDY